MKPKNSQTNSGNTLHITILTSSVPVKSIPNELSLAHDVELLKVALLYADRVRLCSHAASEAVFWSRFRTLEEGEDIVEALAPEEYHRLDPNSFIHDTRTYRRLLRKEHLDEQELQSLQRIEESIGERRQLLIEASEQLVVEAEAVGLNSAMNSGVLEVVNLYKARPFEYLVTLMDSVTSNETYPLLNSAVGSYLTTAIAGRKMVSLGASVGHAKQIGLVQNLMDRLPAFQNATVDEVIDIRGELEKPLVRFRSAIVKFSREIENLPWGDDFPYEANDIFFEHIEPAVLEIEEAYKSNKLLFSLVEQATDKPLIIPSSSALGFLISQASELPNMLSQALSLFAGGAALALKAVKEWRKENEATEQNQLYFYYQTEKLLKG